jgi:hypothetical protein
MRLSLASLIRRLAGLIHPDVLSPLRIMSQTLMFLQHETSSERFNDQIMHDMVGDETPPFRKHLSRLESELHNFKAMKEKIAPEMGEKTELLEDAEKLGKKVIDDFEALLKDLPDEVTDKHFAEGNHSTSCYETRASTRARA